MKVRVKTSRLATLNEIWEMDVPDDTVNAELVSVVQRLFWADGRNYLDLNLVDDECGSSYTPIVIFVSRL